MTFSHAFVPILIAGTLHCLTVYLLLSFVMNSYTVLPCYCAPIFMFGALLQNVQLIVIYLTTPHNWKLCIAATLDSSFAAGLLLLVSLGLPYLFCCCLLDFSIDPEFAIGSLGLLLSLGLVQLIIILVHKHPP